VTTAVLGMAERVDMAVEKARHLHYARGQSVMRHQIEDTGVGLLEVLLGILFSFKGRMRRSRYVGWSIVAIAAFGVIMMPLLFVFIAIGTSEPVVVSGMVQMLLIGGVPFLWILFCLGAKRCHDRGKSARFLLVGLIPVAGWLWLLFELVLRDGTPGWNSFGPSPKQAA